MIRVFAALVLFATLTLVASDAFFHFDQERVNAKRQHKSAQRHWSLYYPQEYTYAESSFKYQSDINNIEQILEPNKVLLSDKATSYYLAAQLPVFVKNIQAHHNQPKSWRETLANSHLCYIDNKEQLNKAKLFIDGLADKENLASHQGLKYWLINRDSNNINLRYDCLSTRRGEISTGLKSLAELVYAGEYLWLYQMH